MTDLTQIHKHHIVPDYWCKSKEGQLKLKELGLTTSYKVDGKEFYFKENLVRIPRKQHALIHWGYYCGDLSLLLEMCNPPQWVLDMIPLGNNKDAGAAQYIALGEIEGIDSYNQLSNNPNWKGGVTIDSVKYQNDIYLDKQKLTLKLLEEGLSYWDLKDKSINGATETVKKFKKDRGLSVDGGFSLHKYVPSHLRPQEEIDRKNEMNRKRYDLKVPCGYCRKNTCEHCLKEGYVLSPDEKQRRKEKYLRDSLELRKEYYQKNKAKIRAQQAKHYARNKLEKVTVTLDNFL